MSHVAAFAAGMLAASLMLVAHAVWQVIRDRWGQR